MFYGNGGHPGHQGRQNRARSQDVCQSRTRTQDGHQSRTCSQDGHQTRTHSQDGHLFGARSRDSRQPGAHSQDGRCPDFYLMMARQILYIVHDRTSYTYFPLTQFVVLGRTRLSIRQTKPEPARLVSFHCLKKLMMMSRMPCYMLFRLPLQKLISRF